MAQLAENSFAGALNNNSYCTLAEVLGYDYTRTTKKRGVVGATEYALWVKRGRKGSPSAWCGGVSGMSVRNVTNEEMDKLIAQGEAGPDRQTKSNDLSYHTQIVWETTYRDSPGQAWFAFLEACKTLGDPTRTRFVFGFDS